MGDYFEAGSDDSKETSKREGGKEEVETSEQEAIINWCVGITEAKKNSFPHFDLEERWERNTKCQRKLNPGLVEQILGLRRTSP